MTLGLFDLAGAEPERRFSPYCWRIRMALAHKNLPVETIPWRFTDKAEIAASGQASVPVLADGNHWVADSWTIANYLEDKFPDSPSLFGNATLDSPRKPSKTMRIFSSAEWCLRVTRRMFFTSR
jgi:glutathione S-transferase